MVGHPIDALLQNLQPVLMKVQDSFVATVHELSHGLDITQAPVAHRSVPAISKDACSSTQIPVTAMVLGGRMGHGQAQALPPLAAETDEPSAAIF